jgi:exopolyphosphatase/guanosine-5'-triphosphate,3'-diphosphate pyrophosphatase
MERVGIIDIGSNSMHLVIGEMNNYEYYNFIDDIKINARLSEGLSETGCLSEERMVIALKALKIYRSVCKAYEVTTVLATATAAVRKADNGEAFIKKAYEESGFDINIISGEKEAYYDYLGVINSIDIRDALLMDIGGGSTEFVLVKDRKLVKSVSLDFGSVDLAENFMLMDFPNKKDITRLHHFLTYNLAKNEIIVEAKGMPVVGIGGTIRNVGRIHRHLVDYPLEMVHNYIMTEKEVKEVCQLTSKMSYEERLDLKGLAKSRADIFVGASQALLKVMDTIKSPQLHISNQGLRDGLVYEYYGFGKENLIYNVLGHSLANISGNYRVNIPHAHHVYGLTKQIFNELRDFHGITQDVDKILRAASILHDMGTIIRFDNHHEHSFYLILHSGINGMTQREIVMSAFMALNHRTNKKAKVFKEYMTMLTEEDKKLINKLSVFLQLAEFLDRSMDGVTERVQMDVQKDKVVLRAHIREDCFLRDLIMDECAKKFYRVFDKPLDIEMCLDNQVMVAE